jgi:DNA polymerase
MQWIDAGGTLVAHNAFRFDAEAFRRFVSAAQVTWYDTLPCSRAAGLPGGLDAIGEALGFGGKDKRGSMAMTALSAAKWNALANSPQYVVGTPSLWEAMLIYNIRDVDLLERVYHETSDYGEPDVIDADLTINRRGVSVDLLLCDALRSAWSHAENEAAAEIETITQGVVKARDVRSVDKLREWMRDFGVKLDSLNKIQVKQFLDDPSDFCEGVEDERIETISRVLQLRAICCNSAGGKLAKLRDSASEGRITDSLVYYGAGPGRWSGRGVQPQNLGRGSEKVPCRQCIEAIESATADAGDDIFAGLPGDEVARTLRDASPGVPLRDILDTLTRPVFRASIGNTLAICDFSGIEPRILSWVARDEDALEVFRKFDAKQGPDPYRTQAGRVFGVAPEAVTKEQRQVGKALVIGCGYGMGAKKFGQSCKNSGINLEAVGVTAEQCVRAFRETRPRVKSLWRDLDRAAMDVVSGERGAVEAGRCRWSMRGPNLICTLPSGRPIVYRNARVEMEVPAYCAMLGLPEEEKPCVKYDHPKGYRKNVYGGLLAENIVQGQGRDLMATAIVRCEVESLPVVLHVHDEIVVEVEESEGDAALRRLEEIMTCVPQWATGLPVAVEGFTCDRYLKSKG